MGRAGPLDQTTFRQLYEAHVGFVQLVAKRAGWKDTAADDVVQETFLRLYQKPPDSLDEKAVRGWLATTARRVIVDLARKTHRERVSGDSVDEATTGSLWFQDDEALERELELLAVREIVDELSSLPGGDDFRAFYVDGLKAREIAERRGEAISTVTTRLSRLRERFRDQLMTRLQKTGTGRA
jgi:RNA polymerase sigma-70 factor (ECF subfamily)